MNMNFIIYVLTQGSHCCISHHNSKIVGDKSRLAVYQLLAVKESAISFVHNHSLMSTISATILNKQPFTYSKLHNDRELYFHHSTNNFRRVSVQSNLQG